MIRSSFIESVRPEKVFALLCSCQVEASDKSSINRNYDNIKRVWHKFTRLQTDSFTNRRRHAHTHASCRTHIRIHTQAPLRESHSHAHIHFQPHTNALIYKIAQHPHPHAHIFSIKLFHTHVHTFLFFKGQLRYHSLSLFLSHPTHSRAQTHHALSFTLTSHAYIHSRIL